MILEKLAFASFVFFKVELYDQILFYRKIFKTSKTMKSTHTP